VSERNCGSRIRDGEEECVWMLLRLRAVTRFALSFGEAIG
jgi:hypothetical protein